MNNLTLNHIKRLQLLHQRIMTSNSGTPKKLAQYLKISERSLRIDLELLKDFGAEIYYDRKSRAYYYGDPFELHIDISIQVFSKGALQKVYGGSFLKKSFVANILP